MLPSGSGRDAIPREFQNLEWLNPHFAHRQSRTNLRSKSSESVLMERLQNHQQEACEPGSEMGRIPELMSIKLLLALQIPLQNT